MKQRKRQYKSVITQRINRSVRKLMAVVLTVSCTATVFVVGQTNAGFSDVEESTGNTWTAGSLDGRATYIEHFDVEGMNPDQAPDHRITFKNVGSLDFRYGVKYRKTAGDDALCMALQLVAERDGVGVYTGPLALFDVEEYAGGGAFVLSSLDADHWDFTATLPGDAGAELENLSCQWSFDFTAWQSELASATLGFSDVEAVDPQVIATGEWLTPGDVVINEVMWMGSTVSGSDEWIELRNMTGSALSLAGWKLENAGTSGTTLTIPAGKSIPAHGYFLIANYGKSHASSALNVEGDWVTTSVALNNSANGNLVLKSPGDLTIDSALGAPEWGAGNHGSSTPFEQSMERNDVPGNGLSASAWHACVSGAANGVPYWDATGNNFGTPLSANLSPIVMNEFVLNPVGDDDQQGVDGEWVELYNILDTPIDVAGWYFTNDADERVVITDDNTIVGATFVPGHGTLVVTLDQAFLDNDEDTLSLFAPGALPEDTTDDVREDTFHYTDADVLPEGKSFARFPDGEGVWIDPVATPGEENEMSTEDRDVLRHQAYEMCFVGEDLDHDATAEICSPIFLSYIGLLDDAGDESIEIGPLLAILEAIRQEEEKELLALLAEESGVGEIEETTLPETTEEPADSGSTSDPATEAGSEDESGVPQTDEVIPTEALEVVPAPDSSAPLPDETVPTETPVTEPEASPVPVAAGDEPVVAKVEEIQAEAVQNEVSLVN